MTLPHWQVGSPADFRDAKLAGSTYNRAPSIYEGEYRTETTVPFEAQITDVAVEGNMLTLAFALMKGYEGNNPAGGVDEEAAGFKKYFYVKDFAVDCTANPALSFTKDMANDTACGQADAFAQFTARHDAAFDYNLYTPAGYAANAMMRSKPIYIIHSVGDNITMSDKTFSEESDELFAKLQEIGNAAARYKKYQPEELFFEGVPVAPHDTEILASEDISSKQWLMEQSLSSAR